MGKGKGPFARKTTDLPWRRVYLIAGAFVAVVAIPVVWRLIAGGPDGEVIVGVRRDATGRVVQEIVCNVTHESSFMLFGPHGPGAHRGVHHDYSFREPGKPPQPFEVSLGEPERIVCLPVEGSNAWVNCPRPQESGTPFYVAVHEGVRLRHLRHLSVDKAPGKPYSVHDYRFEDGNRTLVFRRKGELVRYDVLADTVTPPGRGEN